MRPDADAAAFSEPVGRTSAPAYSGAEAGIAPAGSAALPLVWEEPQPVIAAQATSMSSADAECARLPGRGSRWAGIAGDRSDWGRPQTPIAGQARLQGTSHADGLHPHLH